MPNFLKHDLRLGVIGAPSALPYFAPEFQGFLGYVTHYIYGRSQEQRFNLGLICH